MDGDRKEEAWLLESVGASLGEGQKVDWIGDVMFVEVVILDVSVEMVLIDSVSEFFLRYESLGRRRVG